MSGASPEAAPSSRREGSKRIPYDAEIGVVGAGPAGARAAELLAGAGADVLVWDPRAPWEKPCGGGLPASAFRYAPELEALRGSARRIETVHFQVSSDGGFPVRLDRPMYMVSRARLSRWQLERMEAAGASRIPVAIGSIRRDDGGWTVEDREGRSWRVRLLVGADGAASLVRRVASPDLKIELAPTRVSYPDGVGPTPGTALVRLYDEVEGYFWDFSRPDHRSVGVGTEPGQWNRSRMDREIDLYCSTGNGPGKHAPRAESSLENLEKGARRSAKDAARETPDPGGDGTGRPARPRTGAVIGTAALGHGDFSGVGGADFALLGDAAGLADPATGEGIQNALRSAGLLADAYRSSGTLSSYPARVREAFDREFRAGRVLRKALFGAGMGPYLVRRGEESRWATSLVSAVMNATNEHDLGVWSLLRRTAKALREAR